MLTGTTTTTHLQDSTKTIPRPTGPREPRSPLLPLLTQQSLTPRGIFSKCARGAAVGQGGQRRSADTQARRGQNCGGFGATISSRAAAVAPSAA